METIEQLDDDITALNSRIATLRAHRANLASVLLSQPHLSSRLSTSPSHDKPTSTLQRAIALQSRLNTTNIHRACAGVTAYKVQDPDPNAVNEGNVLGVSIDVSLAGRFVETYHVLLNFRGSGESKVLRIHKHTIPPCIPLQHLASKWLPVGGGKEGEEGREQDLVKFGRALRKELVAWHMRVNAVEELRREAGCSHRRDEGDDTSVGTVLNAFVSDDDASSDAEAGEDNGDVSILDIGTDTAVRQITISWSDARTAVMNVTKDGRVEKAVCRAKNGTRDVALGRKAVGPLGGLIRRLTA